MKLTEWELPRGVLFDLFQTLVLPMAAAEREAVVHSMGLDERTPGYWEARAGMAEGLLLAAAGKEGASAHRVLLTRTLPSFAAMWTAIGGEAGATQPPGILPRTEALFDAFFKGCRLDPGAKELLEELRARGVRLGLVSNAHSLWVPIVEALGLERYFPEPVFSCQEACCKPAPALFQKALQQMGLAPEEVWMVGDTWTSDVIGSLKLGMKPVWVDRGEDLIAAAISAGAVGQLLERDAGGFWTLAAEGQRTLTPYFPTELPALLEELNGAPAAGSSTLESLEGVLRVASLRALSQQLGYGAVP